jgi:hypothetical protein
MTPKVGKITCESYPQIIQEAPEMIVLGDTERDLKRSNEA